MTTATVAVSARKVSKRIQSITIKRMYDSDGDTSWLGEYSDQRTSKFSIDRAHNDDCASISEESAKAADMLQRAIDYLNRDDFEDPSGSGMGAVNILSQAIEDATECDCSRAGRHDPRTYRYFNPSDNYTGEPDEDIKKYVAQDYARMEALNEGQWCFIGIQAEADIRVDGTLQRIHSGGLWGIESDSEDSYFAEVAQEELAQLRGQLAALGFSKRAIATAVKDVREGGDAR